MPLLLEERNLSVVVSVGNGTISVLGAAWRSPVKPSQEMFEPKSGGYRSCGLFLLMIEDDDLRRRDPKTLETSRSLRTSLF